MQVGARSIALTVELEGRWAGSADAAVQEAVVCFERRLASRSAYLSAHSARTLQRRVDALKTRDDSDGASNTSVPLGLGLGLLVTVEPSARVQARQSADPATGAVSGAEMHASISPSLAGVCRSETNTETDDIFLCGLSGARVSVPKALASASLRGVSASEVHLGACKGAVYIEDVRDSAVHCAAHQLRLSRCSNVALYARVPTAIVIEESSGITVRPLVPWYPRFDADMCECALHGLGGSERLPEILNFTTL